ncbi:hypothetical protein DSM104299_01142 [Baekduia alba]|uniref:hypothetical protein n=1 Tax=Baekduia alba TaxID=2997333 RepID=UPI002341F596|nr:hypothetical protein [Baekduia alba]WCB92446.1 hypothetical protein DSM104299_01142 [Baekduia alba]
MTRIDIDVDDRETLALWEALGGLAAELPGDWILIGGLMVQLHALERGARDVRVTADIDVLGQARPPGALDAIDEALLAEGFEVAGPDVDGYAHRYRRAGLVVDVLSPDGIRPPASIGGLKAVGVPGGTQALARAESVTVSVGGREFSLRRPTLLGAILIKARSLMTHADPEAQREDLLRLLAMVEDPRALAADLRTTERRWLRDAEARLAFDSYTTLDEPTVRLAAQAFRLLVIRR